MKYPSRSLSAAIGTLLLSVGAPSLVAAQADPYKPVTKENTQTQMQAQQYWTPERFKAAKPLDLPLANKEAVREMTVQPGQGGVPQGTSGQPPSLSPKLSPSLMYVPDASQLNTNRQGIEPQDMGTFRTPFTSTRVFPLFGGGAANYSADRAYPHRTVGKLFFSINGAPYVCSASVIQRRVVATAGHCVHSGTAAGFHSNWVFAPAYRDGVAPLKYWNWSFATTTGTWASGGGGVPNAADYAMIEFADQPLVAGGPLVKLGNLTGWLGWRTLTLSGNHTSKLGYPCNLDSCQKMQNVTSTSYRNVAPNNVEYGSDARGGSSGGPWVQNFETQSVGGGTGLNPGPNQVVGITSYGYVSTDPKVQGSSILDSRWVQLWNLICSRAGNCS
jgi:V8-like Glu-specific endopeptidase